MDLQNLLEMQIKREKLYKQEKIVEKKDLLLIIRKKNPRLLTV